MKQNNSISDTKNLVLCAVCAAITCVLAPLSIPLAGGVPISLATFAVMLAGVLLGGSLGALSQLIYVLLGAVGLPVFAGWTGGLGNVLGMTGGFIIGYIPCAWLTGLIYKKFDPRSLPCSMRHSLYPRQLYQNGSRHHCCPSRGDSDPQDHVRQ